MGIRLLLYDWDLFPAPVPRTINRPGPKFDTSPILIACLPAVPPNGNDMLIPPSGDAPTRRYVAEQEPFQRPARAPLPMI
jgi:hypothetical protein